MLQEPPDGLAVELVVDLLGQLEDPGDAGVGLRHWSLRGETWPSCRSASPWSGARATVV